VIALALSGSLDIGHIRASYIFPVTLVPCIPKKESLIINLTIRLRDSQTKSKVTPRNTRKPTPLLLRRSKSRDRRTPNPIPTTKPPYNTHKAHAGQFIPNNQSTPGIPLIAWYISRQRQTSRVLLRREGVHDTEAELAMTSPHLLRDLSGSLPFLGVRSDGSLDVFADPGA
jgi:hypothetical protein